MPLHPEPSLFSLVENRSAYSLENCELNVFETHQSAVNVNLSFKDWVLTSMLRGKKVMHLFNKPAFEYLPGESVIVPPHEVMKIDFPEAERTNPTQCVALAISAEQIRRTIDALNERCPKADSQDQWGLNQNFFHLINNQELAESINRLIRLSLNDKTREKDMLAGLTLRELLIRLMQTQARKLFELNYAQLSGSYRFAHVMQYIKENITAKLEVDKLSEQACMSRANFFRKFKEQFGYTPADYILQERLRLAKKYLQNPFNSITQVCFMAGFQNLHYFIRVFKKVTGNTPKAYQQQYKINEA
ncbi:AraC family transcriptional regulator [Adhaeribacter arboris]|uniref:AraC family transcriptional regulator n=1 Tax=Adhaeribacter arboris TaxID=2072846 RepID=UPI001E5C3370|nr:AraC family transcriptional regulator [Adhaeribacter arboris]